VSAIEPVDAEGVRRVVARSLALEIERTALADIVQTIVNERGWACQWGTSTPRPDAHLQSCVLCRLRRLVGGRFIHDDAELLRRSRLAQSSSDAPVTWRIEVTREPDSYWAAATSGDGRVGCSGDGAATPVGALANLCATLIKIAEDDATTKQEATR